MQVRLIEYLGQGIEFVLAVVSKPQPWCGPFRGRSRLLGPGRLLGRREEPSNIILGCFDGSGDEGYLREPPLYRSAAQGADLVLLMIGKPGVIVVVGP